MGLFVDPVAPMAEERASEHTLAGHLLLWLDSGGIIRVGGELGEQASSAARSRRLGVKVTDQVKVLPELSVHESA